MDMRVLSVINLKGGVAKTISSVAIAHLLAEKGFCVLLVDNDKQGDASSQRLFQPGLLLPRLIQQHFQICFQQLHVCRDNVQAGEVNTTEGLAELAEQIEFTREDLNPELTFRGCFITKYDKRNEAHAQGAAQLEAAGKYEVVLIPHLFKRLFQPRLLLAGLIQQHFQIRFQQFHVCRDNVQAGEVRVLDQFAHYKVRQKE